MRLITVGGKRGGSDNASQDRSGASYALLLHLTGNRTLIDTVIVSCDTL